MLDVLERLEATDLPRLLRDDDLWQSVWIDYHPPFVERLWCAWGDHRVSLHRIFPCTREQALFHPHPWPQAIHVLSGVYEMLCGFGAGDARPPVAQVIVARGDLRYEMTHPDAWHAVRPLGEPSLSIMLTGKPWTRTAPRSDKPLRPLDPAKKRALLEELRLRFPQ